MLHGCSIYLFLSLLLLTLVIRQAKGSSNIHSLADLKEFLSASYISKETGYFQFKPEKNKIFFADGYNPNWGVYRFHHVCVRGGGDGIYTGMHGVVNKGSAAEGHMTQADWNDFVGAKFNNPLGAYNLNESSFKSDNLPLLHHNSTLFVNCHRQHR